MNTKLIIDITPAYPGYDSYEKDSDGKIILPRKQMEVNGTNRNVIAIYRKNVIDFGNGLLGLLDGSKISIKDWTDLRKCFCIIDDDGTEHFHWSVGGSDTGALTGVSPYSNEEILFDDKLSDKSTEYDAKTEYRFEYGHINEELIAKGFAIKTNMRVVKNNTVFFNEQIGFMQANVDYLVEHPDGSFSILEIKSVYSGAVSTIQDYKKGIVPLYYYTQAVLHYPAVLGTVFNIKGTFFAVGYNNNLDEIIMCHFERDFEQEPKLIAAEKEFVDSLNAGIRPTATNTLVSAKDVIDHLNSLFPKAEEKSCTLSENAVNAVACYQNLQTQIIELQVAIDKLEKQKEYCKSIIIEEIKDCNSSENFAVGNDLFYIEYMNTSRTTIDKTILETKYPEIFNECGKVSKFRKFAIKKVKPPKTPKKKKG